MINRIKNQLLKLRNKFSFLNHKAFKNKFNTKISLIKKAQVIIPNFLKKPLDLPTIPNIETVLPQTIQPVEPVRVFELPKLPKPFFPKINEPLVSELLALEPPGIISIPSFEIIAGLLYASIPYGIILLPYVLGGILYYTFSDTPLPLDISNPTVPFIPPLGETNDDKPDKEDSKVYTVEHTIFGLELDAILLCIRNFPTQNLRIGTIAKVIEIINDNTINIEIMEIPQINCNYLEKKIQKFLQ